MTSKASGWDPQPASDAQVEAHADHEVLHPPHTLKDMAYVATRRGDPTDDQVVEQAETELAEVADEFGEWMATEITRLADARAKYRVYGAKETYRELFQAAHTIRGDAGVFGFPLAGRVADSLAKLLDGCPPEILPELLVDQHVDAIRAIIREGARDSSNAQARELTNALIKVTADLLQTLSPRADAAA
ncbi:Hpt domain-containing protein [Terrarubrum flagellatum]|uniref:Hpt domain-containing protein n=1 Tax=Terrirubrum flagellatum TaxID=2895980 RepID=UPI0031453840